LRRWTTPVRTTGYQIKVPTGTSDVLRARLEESSADDLATLNWYTVRGGESLTSIARKLRVGKADLAEANYMSTKSRVRPGQKLVIPRAPAVLMAARLNRSTPVAESRAVAAVAENVAAAPDAQQSNRVRLIYRVKRGDTLFSIAQLFRTTVSSLRAWNRLSSTRIQIGDRLTVFTSRAVKAAAR
jgi:LysM repeat protein